MFRSRFMPCRECGDSVDRADLSQHECSRDRWADYQMFALRDEVAQLEIGFCHYVATAPGRFEVWLAARQIRGQA